MKPTLAVTDSLLTAQDVAEILRISIRKVWRREDAGTIPPAIRLGRKTVRWKTSAIQAFLDGLDPTS